MWRRGGELEEAGGDLRRGVIPFPPKHNASIVRFHLNTILVSSVFPQFFHNTFRELIGPYDISTYL